MNTSNYMGVATGVLRAGLFCLFSLSPPPLPRWTFHYLRAKIRSVNDSINVDGLLTEPAWQQTPVIDAFSYPWFKAGQKERTEVRMLWDHGYL